MSTSGQQQPLSGFEPRISRCDDSFHEPLARPNRREGYVMLFDGVQNTWVRLPHRPRCKCRSCSSHGCDGKWYAPALSKVSHVYCSVDERNMLSSTRSCWCSTPPRCKIYCAYGYRTSGWRVVSLSTLWPEYTPVSPVEDLVKFKALVSLGCTRTCSVICSHRLCFRERQAARSTWQDRRR